MPALQSVWRTFRRPAYVGENRCLPCTVVNLLITVMLAGAVAIASLPAALLVASVGILAIYLRGYLVPGTPTITSRYFPTALLRLFGHARTETAEVDPSIVGEDVLEFCPEARVIETDDEGEPALADGFRTSWNEHIASLRDTDYEALLASTFDIDATALSVEENNQWFVVYANGNKLTHWRSEAAFLADLAGDRALADWADDWGTLHQQQRGQILARLRVMLLDCPLCAEELRIRESSGCCPGEVAIVLDCPDCGARVLEQPE